ncbi:MAG: sensor histidine kinase/response regulator [Phenylobacterium sp.]|nr:sensor histidine kinase/response regulator [Phenylobacterium sp.]
MFSRKPPIKTPTAHVEGQDLLAFPHPWRRIAIGALVAIVGWPVAPPAVVLVWLALWAAVSLAEQLIARAKGFVQADAAGLGVSFALSVVQALAAIALIQKGGGGTRLFAVALMGFSTVNILLRFYAAPRMLLVTMAPWAFVIASVCWNILVLSLKQGNYLQALTPVATLMVYVFMIWPTRGKLMEAWVRLLDAKALAQEREAAAETASRAKTDFLATMSHEIRTPLNGILGMAQALQADRLPAAQADRVKVIRSCGETLLAILNDVLDLSRIEAGQLHVEREVFDMEHVTRGAVATFGPLAGKKGLTFGFSITEAAKGAYLGDRIRLRQVLYNLVSNAVKFTDAGAIAVGVSCQDGDVVLEVADSGCGIAADKLDRIFDKFVQGDASTTRRAGGTGLGLAICRELCALMGGTIAVTSAQGRGSIFTVRLPLERVSAPRLLEAVPEAPAAKGAAATATAAAKAHPIRILAAEDNEVNRLVLTTLLAQAGVALTLVEDGAQAVEAWRTGDWDVILMDIQMPVKDGVAATREIRAEEAAAGRPRIPILAVTANAMPTQCAAYHAAGMDLVVPKPLEAGRLFLAIDQALAGELPTAQVA